MSYRPTIHYIVLLVILLRVNSEAAFQSVNIGIPPMWNFSNKTYKAGTQNWDADQDSRGVMYWANNDGLLRYDGTNWICLPVANHTIVRSVAIDSTDKIYVGAQSELGYFLPGQNGCHTYHSLIDLLPEDQRAFEDVWDIVIYEQDVFFRTNHVVFQYSGWENDNPQAEGKPTFHVCDQGGLMHSDRCL